MLKGNRGFKLFILVWLPFFICSDMVDTFAGLIPIFCRLSGVPNLLGLTQSAFAIAEPIKLRIVLCDVTLGGVCDCDVTIAAAFLVITSDVANFELPLAFFSSCGVPNTIL